MIKHKVEELNKVERCIYVSYIMPRLKQYFKILKKKISNKPLFLKI